MCRERQRCSLGSYDLPVSHLPSLSTLCRDLILTGFILLFDVSVGHHSTSDDSFAYRPRQEVEDRKRIDNPIARFRLFLHSQGWWSDAEEEELKDRLKQDVMKAFKKAEATKRWPLGELFEDVYGGEQPWNLVRFQLLRSPDDQPWYVVEVSLMCDYSFFLCRRSRRKSWMDC